MTLEVTVVDSSGKPIQGVEVTVVNNNNGNSSSRFTDGTGYTNHSVSGAAGDFCTFISNGYVFNQQYFNLTEHDQKITLVATASFKKPSRDQIVNVKANFCNLIDSEGLPIFEDFIDELIITNPAKAEDWVRILKAAGSTHINLAISGDYNEPLGWADRYPIAGHDWVNDMDGFSHILDWVQRRGLIPFVKLALDGQGYDSVGWTYGWLWGLENIEQILNQLEKYWNLCLWSTGYDGCFPDWNPNQTITMLRLLRNILGEQACLDTEFSGPGTVGYAHMGNGAADWADDKLGILDNFSIELNTFPPNDTGVQQTAARLLGPAKQNIAPENDGPYYLINTTKKVNICMYETCAYQAIRKQATQAQILAANQKCAFYGFKSFGNGQP